MSGSVALRLPDGRLHLQHGPIDCIVEAWGDAEEIEAAYAQAARRFGHILPALVHELGLLRQAVRAAFPLLRDATAKRMVAAVWPYRERFITPMAAVAGAVADELSLALVAGRTLTRACVNNGGDIALHLDADASFDVGIVGDPQRPAVDARVRIHGSDPVRGIATSGWRGRSQSLGIADAVTVLAGSAAAADAAATMIANAVDVAHPAIHRLPARAVKADSDLGDLPVTVEVGDLPLAAVTSALDAGLARARAFQREGLIHAAYLGLRGQSRALAAPVANSLGGTLGGTLEARAC